MGQDLESCGTTQVAGCADRSFLTPHYVSRIDNGYGSRRPLLAKTLSCRPHKPIHLYLRRGISTVNRSLNTFGKATLLNHRFYRYCGNNSTTEFICQVLFENFFLFPLKCRFPCFYLPNLLLRLKA